MTKEEQKLADALAKTEGVIAEAQKRMEPLQRIIKRAYKTKEKIQTQLDEIRLAANPGWDYLLQSGNSMAHYKAGEEALRNIGLRASGMIPTTGQRVIQLSVNSDEDLATYEASLNAVLPHILSTEVKEFQFADACYFGLFDYDCSEYASFNVVLDKTDNTWWVCGMRYHRGKRFRQFPALRDLLEYLKVHHPADVAGPDRYTLYDFYS